MTNPTDLTDRCLAHLLADGELNVDNPPALGPNVRRVHIKIALEQLEAQGYARRIDSSNGPTWVFAN